MTNLLFGKGITKQEVEALSALDFEAMKEAIPFATLAKSELDLGIIDALGAKTGFLSSNGEARRELKGNAISVNKEKVKEDFVISTSDIIANAYVLLQRGKKNYFLLKIA